jgi:hypothetical protein
MDPGPSPSPGPSGPSAGARLLAFGAIVVAGACGGLIGWAVTDLQCTGDCDTAVGIGGVAGAVLAAGGVAVLAVLVLRALGEWKAQAARADVWPPVPESDRGPDAGPPPT